MLRTSLFWLSLWYLALDGVVANLHAAEPIAKPEAENQLLLLHNGNVLQGKITRRGDYYRVVFPHGEMRVPAGQVDLCCASLEDAYLELRTSRIGSTADSHVELATWCLRHDLIDCARRELVDARTIDSEHPDVSRIERQIDQQTRALKHSSKNEKKRQETPGVATPGLDPLVAPIPEIMKIPRSARATFVRQIEPMLLHHCATSGCHHPKSSQRFRLDRLAMIGRGHPGLTRRNLANVAQQLGTKSAASGGPLLSRAATPHGGTLGVESTPLDAMQLEILRNWVGELATQNMDRRQERSISTADTRNRLMKIWDKSSGADMRNSVVIRKSSAPIYFHPTQTVRVQQAEPHPENKSNQTPMPTEEQAE